MARQTERPGGECETGVSGELKSEQQRRGPPKRALLPRATAPPDEDANRDPTTPCDRRAQSEMPVSQRQPVGHGRRKKCGRNKPSSAIRECLSVRHRTFMFARLPASAKRSRSRADLWNLPGRADCDGHSAERLQARNAHDARSPERVPPGGPSVAQTGWGQPTPGSARPARMPGSGRASVRLRRRACPCGRRNRRPGRR